ncbi:DUF1189 domain-containing protein [Bacillus sp. AGMB 02131]|uniref:DUF1189 domain-containing protein n=1 Tax=Peribacillus faecalis TaxID=2772559 RepID=A0A927CU64_9BACI|nr:DUF1189 domain-containing protein [Peribacillus faecalis]MBD3107638.1 DUF1189 domain-containing protein [Peribacillus faecalis]
MNIFKQLWLSLYSPKDIAKFRFQGIGKTILYVFLLVLISSLPVFITTANSVNNGAQALQNAIEQKLPDFEISNGHLQADNDAPIEVTNDEFDIYFDAQGTWSVNDIALKSDNALAILPTEFVLVTNGVVQSQPYSLFEGFDLTKANIMQFMEQMDGLLTILLAIIIVVSYIFTAGLKFIEITMLALFATLILNINKKKLQYRHMWRISAYSVTLATIFFAIMNAMQVIVIGGVFVNWGVSFVIVYLAYKEIPFPKQKTQTID